MAGAETFLRWSPPSCPVVGTKRRKRRGRYPPGTSAGATNGRRPLRLGVMDGEAMRGDGYERDEGEARPFYGFGTVDAESPPRDADDDHTQDHPRYFGEPPRAAAAPY